MIYFLNYILKRCWLLFICPGGCVPPHSLWQETDTKILPTKLREQRYVCAMHLYSQFLYYKLLFSSPPISWEVTYLNTLRPRGMNIIIWGGLDKWSFGWLNFRCHFYCIWTCTQVASKYDQPSNDVIRSLWKQCSWWRMVIHKLLYHCSLSISINLIFKRAINESCLPEKKTGLPCSVGSHFSVIRNFTYLKPQNNDIHRYFAVH